MAGADWGIIILLGISTLVGMQRGFFREALSLVTWVLALSVAISFSAQLAQVTTEAINTSSWEIPEFINYFLVETPFVTRALAFVLLCVVTLIIGGLVNNLLTSVVRNTGLSGLDRFLGTLFGLTRGLLIGLILVAGFKAWTPVEEYDWWQESTLVPAFLSVLDQLPPALLEEGKEVLQDSPALL